MTDNTLREAGREAKLLTAIRAEAKRANDVIKLNRHRGGQGMITVATALHRIANWSEEAIAMPLPTTQPTGNTGLKDVEAMREACAKVVEGYRQNGPSNWQAMVEKIRALPLPMAQEPGL